MRCSWAILLATVIAPVLAAAEGPVDKDGRPLIRKLGTVSLANAAFTSGLLTVMPSTCTWLFASFFISA